MIRPVTCLCLLLAAGSGLYLYQTKHQSQMLDREIDRVRRETSAARSRASVLRAEYALLTEPSRLAELADHYLALKSTEPKQFAVWSDLDKRLPPVGIPAVEPEPLEPAVAQAPAPLTPPRPTDAAHLAEAPRPAASSAPRSIVASVLAPSPPVVPLIANGPLTGPTRPTVTIVPARLVSTAVGTSEDMHPVATRIADSAGSTRMSGGIVATPLAPPTPLAPERHPAYPPARPAYAPPAEPSRVVARPQRPAVPERPAPSVRPAPYTPAAPIGPPPPPLTRSALGMARTMPSGGAYPSGTSQ